MVEEIKVEEIKSGSVATVDMADAVERALKEGCLLRIKTNEWGNRVTMHQDEMANLPTEIVRGTKSLINKEALKEIKAIKLKAMMWARKNTLPWVDDGSYYIPKGKIAEGREYLNQCISEMEIAVEKLVENYDSFVSDMKSQVELHNSCNPQSKIDFSEDKYPKKDELKDRFKIFYQFYMIAIPESGLGVLTEEQAKEERVKLNKSIQEAAEIGIQHLRHLFVEMVSHLRNKISQGSSFRNSSVVKIQEFVNDFETLNVWNDKELSALIAKCRGYMNGVDADALRNDEAFSNKVESNLSEVMGDVVKLIGDRIERHMDF